MQRVPLGSPTKENQNSPVKKGKGTPFGELIGFIKNSGVHVPPGIAKIMASGTNPESPVKRINSHRDGGEEAKKLKVQLSDIEFEYKKLEEDFAQFKRTSKGQKEREAKKNEEAIMKLKSALECSNEDGMYNIAKMKQEHQEELNGVKERARMEHQQEKTKIINEYETKLSNQDRCQTRQVAEMKKEHQKVYNDKVRSMTEEIEEIQAKHVREMREVAVKNKQTIEDRDKRYESIRVAIESEKRTEEKLHEKTKMEAIKEKEKLISELCFEKNVKVHLEETVETREKEIRKLKNTIKDKEDEITLLQEKTKKKLQQNEAGYKQKVEEMVFTQGEEIKSINEKHIKEIQKYQKKIQKMDKLRREKEELMTGNYEQLNSLFEKRPSKKEDISQLEKMKWALAKREEEIRKLTKDIKYCNLQLQNKEDLYTRMFRGSSMSRDKKNRPIQKQQKEKENHLIDDKLGKEYVYRRSQTSDIKFLLKVYNNNKFQS